MNVSKVMLNQKDYQWLKFLGITLKPSHPLKGVALHPTTEVRGLCARLL